jgi:type VI secretion system protein ImpL
LRPILVRPLIQAFAVIISPTEAEMNKIWQAQVFEPFQKALANKYPFSSDSRMEASAAEISQIFGSEGAIAKFVNTSMGPLVVRRGDVLAAKTWADMGINLSPAVLTNFSSWVAPLSASGVPSANANDGQWSFQVQPSSAPGTTEYTLEIDGQQVRYRNAQPQWSSLIWPNPQGTPGAKITAVTFDGRVIEVANFPGKFGFNRLMEAAQKKRKPADIYELSWSSGNISVAVNLKIISKPDAPSDNASPQGKGFRGMKLPGSIIDSAIVARNQSADGAANTLAYSANPVATGAAQ